MIKNKIADGLLCFVLIYWTILHCSLLLLFATLAFLAGRPVYGLRVFKLIQHRLVNTFRHVVAIFTKGMRAASEDFPS